MDEDKIHRKQKRKQTQYLKQEPNTDVRFQEEPSVYMFIGNGGLRNGVSKEVLEYIFRPTTLSQLYLPSGKDYAFGTFPSIPDASKALLSINGICIQDACKENKGVLNFLPPVVLSGPPLHLYLSFVNKIPQSIECADSGVCEIPPGLHLVQDFISADEEKQLLKFFAFSSELDFSHKHSDDEATAAPFGRGAADCSPPHNALRQRQVMHFGYEFLYGSNLVDPSNSLPGGLPGITHPLLERMIERGLVTEHPDQLTVNQYIPGAGIPSHVDTHSVFQGPIISLSLGSQVVMEFKHPDGRKVPVFLSPRSLLVMTGETRYLWSHGIPARKHDEVFSGLLGYCLTLPKNAPERNALPRSTRVSLTFRKVRASPSVCHCDYPLCCDSAPLSLPPDT